MHAIEDQCIILAVPDLLKPFVNFKGRVVGGPNAIVYLKPDVAIMHIYAGISGDFENDGPPRAPRHVTGT
jgi:hypothetical protein